MRLSIYLLLLLLLSTRPLLYSQNVEPKNCLLKPSSYQASFFTNQYYFPFTGIDNLWSARWHPGVAFGISKDLKIKLKRSTFYDLKLGIFNDQFVQTGIQFYGNFGLRYQWTNAMFASVKYSLGYLHSIKHQKTFKSDEKGEYEKVANWGRPQLLTGLGIQLGKQFLIGEQNTRIYIEYQPWFQLPYIKSYVPLLPNNSFHLGFDYILK